MKTTYKPKVFICALTAVLCMITLSSPAFALEDNATITAEGSIAAITSLDVEVPVSTTFSIEADRTFTAAEFTVTNNSPVPVTVTADSIKAKEGTSAKVVAEDSHTAEEWDNLNSSQTNRQIALAIKTLESSDLVDPVSSDPQWFGAEEVESNLILGVIQSAYGKDSSPKMNLTFDAKYGKSWRNVSQIQYDMLLTVTAD